MMWDRQIETNSSAAALIAIRSGAGIGALPTAALTVAPELVMISEGPLAKITLWLIHHRDARKTERTRRVMEWLAVVFDNRANPWYREEYVAPADFPPPSDETAIEAPAPQQTPHRARDAG